MYKFKKLSDFEIETLIEIPGDDSGLTDIENDSDDEYFEERDYLDVPDPNSNVQLQQLNIMGMLLIFLKMSWFLLFIYNKYSIILELPIEFTDDLEFEPVAGPSSDVQSTSYIVENCTEKDKTGKKRQKKQKIILTIVRTRKKNQPLCYNS